MNGKTPFLHLEQATRQDESCDLHKEHQGSTETPARELTKYAQQIQNHTPPWQVRALTASVQPNWFFNFGSWLRKIETNLVTGARTYPRCRHNRLRRGGWGVGPGIYKWTTIEYCVMLFFSVQRLFWSPCTCSSID